MQKKLLSVHGRQIHGHPKKIEARILDQTLSIEEIFDEVMHQMETQERAADFRRPRENSNYGEAHIHKLKNRKEKMRKMTKTS